MYIFPPLSNAAYTDLQSFRSDVSLLQEEAFDSLSEYLANQFHISCRDSAIPTQLNKGFCKFVDWNSARLFVKNESTTIGNKIGYDKQDALAKYTYDYFVENKHVSSDCRQGLKRLICIEIFPECPLSGLTYSSPSHLKTCRLQCEQAAYLCQQYNIKGLNYDTCQSTYPTSGCAMYIPPFSFALPPQQGPYNIFPYLYTFLLLLWIIGLGFWLFLVFRTRVNPRFDHNYIFLSFIPFLKIVVLGSCCALWIQCIQHGNICPSFLTLVVIKLQQIYESGQLMFFLWTSSGFNVTKIYHMVFEDAIELRNDVLLVFSFYVISVVSLGINPAGPPNMFGVPWLGWCLLIFMYLLLYWTIIATTLRELADMYSQYLKLSQRSNPQVVDVIKYKYGLYKTLLMLFLLSMIVDTLCNYLFAINYPYIFTLLLYELTQIFIYCWIAYLIQPTQRSPFYYMIPISTTNGDFSALHGGARVVQLIELYDKQNSSNGTTNQDSDQYPLLSSNNNPDEEVVLSASWVSTQSADTEAMWHSSYDILPDRVAASDQIQLIAVRDPTNDLAVGVRKVDVIEHTRRNNTNISDWYSYIPSFLTPVRRTAPVQPLP
eukprot:gene4127-5881_t